MLATLGIGALVLALVLVAAIATRPAAFRVQRGTAIAAPAEVVFAHLADLRRWAAWNPFQKVDPTMQVTHGGAAAGVGSSYHYAGKKIGEGRMTIAEIQPSRHVGVKAEFIRPCTATNRIDFTVEPAATGVTLTWAISGRNTFTGKAFSLFVNMDRMIGGDFEKGLADLKRIAEAEAAASTSRSSARALRGAAA
ncbi:MAG TPA: SRPBCC family protein [Longimicrobium sp.]|nr:SRPBCC family protein [Longimicrobium sp.]